MIKTSKGMLYRDTPIEDYTKRWGLCVKREDLSCPPPGPPFSKTRGVYARVSSREENLIGVLDTFHSQAGQAVARACSLLGKRCINFYPAYKRDLTDIHDCQSSPLRRPQILAKSLGAEMHGLRAGRSCILYHAAKRITEHAGGYIMPNALKLHESVTETSREVTRRCLDFDYVLVAISSGTIAAGVLKGLNELSGGDPPPLILHMGYDRSEESTTRYIEKEAGCSLSKRSILINEKYSYKDKSKAGEDPDWACNEYYDLKAFRWWRANPVANTLMWNIG